jgi:hypothetical protein
MIIHSLMFLIYFRDDIDIGLDFVENMGSCHLLMMFQKQVQRKCLRHTFLCGHRTPLVL